MTKLAFWIIRRTIQKDPSYAWAWHCNIACASQDEGMDHAASNRAASRFMRLAFGANGYEPK